MPFYYQQGDIPLKPHTQFYKENGELYREELFSMHGFQHIFSNKYHHQMPTKILQTEHISIQHGEIWKQPLIQNYKVNTNKLESSGNYIRSRQKIFFNDDIALYSANITQKSSEFYRNNCADEVLFIHQGSGIFYSEFGSIKLEQWDYLIIPRGTTYQLDFKDSMRILVIESFSMVEIPNSFRNSYGQLIEQAPYKERDIKQPTLQKPILEQGKFPVIQKFGDRYQQSFLEWHPFDVVGWDGYAYPWAINLKNYDPIVGKIHQPPSMHQILQTNNAMICNFTPRPFDFHPNAIPAPYFHNNIDCDEVIYYIDGDFMSRKNIGAGYMTLHPKGIPHGPQPGKTEASISAERTNEYALMIDTFNPLHLTTHVQQIMIQDYAQSWIE